MKKFIFSNFNKSILNISSTLSTYLGCKNDKPILNELLDELKKNYKNIVFMCIDGLGIGNRWTPEEEKQLLEEYSNGMKISEIAKIHSRNIGGIRSRLRKLGAIE